VGGGAIALFVFLFFFKWYGLSVSSSAGRPGIGHSENGWHAFTTSRWIWLITIVAGLGALSKTGDSLRRSVRCSRAQTPTAGVQPFGNQGASWVGRQSRWFWSEAVTQTVCDSEARGGASVSEEELDG
jgi:hypothetical protein